MVYNYSIAIVHLSITNVYNFKFNYLFDNRVLFETFFIIKKEMTVEKYFSLNKI